MKAHVPFSRRGFIGPPGLFPWAFFRGAARRNVDGEISSGRSPFFPGIHETNRAAGADVGSAYPHNERIERA